MDSDGDGVPNGVELGDPDCKWKVGMSDPDGLLLKGHPGVDEKKSPPRSLFPRLRNVPPLVNTTYRKASVETKWGVFFDGLPNARPFKEVGRIDERVLFSVYYFMIPSFIIVASLLDVQKTASVRLSWWKPIVSWLLLYSGIAIGYHRLFSHKSFEPVRGMKIVMAFLGVMGGQGDPTYWAALHRTHHNMCEEEPDPHSPSTSRGAFHAHGGFLWDSKSIFDLKSAVPDLANDPDLLVFQKYAPFIFVLLPVLMVLAYMYSCHMWSWWQARSPISRVTQHKVGLKLITFYYYLPVLLTMHNSFLINSVSHMWGYETFDDAMSANCDSTNLPFFSLSCSEKITITTTMASRPLSTQECTGGS